MSGMTRSAQQSRGADVGRGRGVLGRVGACLAGPCDHASRRVDESLPIVGLPSGRFAGLASSALGQELPRPGTLPRPMGGAPATREIQVGGGSAALARAVVAPTRIAAMTSMEARCRCRLNTRRAALSQHPTHAASMGLRFGREGGGGLFVAQGTPWSWDRCGAAPEVWSLGGEWCSWAHVDRNYCF